MEKSFYSFFLSKFKYFESCSQQKEKHWMLALKKNNSPGSMSVGLHFLSSNKCCTFKRLFCFGLHFLYRSFWRKLVLGKKCVNHRLQNGTARWKWGCLYFDFCTWTCTLMWNCHLLEREGFTGVRTWGRGFLFHVLTSRNMAWFLRVIYLIPYKRRIRFFPCIL